MTLVNPEPTAVIAEDEPILARTLTRLLEQVWPELRIVGVAEDYAQGEVCSARCSSRCAPIQQMH